VAASRRVRIAAALFELLNDRTQVADDAALPRSGSGLPRDWDRILSAPFVLHRITAPAARP